MIACSRCGRENADDARFCSNCANPLTPAAASTGEVRKTVTVMFMDAVGSTSAGAQTDPESLRRVMTRYFDEIRTVVERHGGTVEKYIGDAVMAVFGVPTVHEDDALRALRAAVEIRSRLANVSDELLRERGFSVEWRTGINTGEVVAGDAGAGQRFVSGDAVNVAARLEQTAQPGEILLGDETHRLVRNAVSAVQAEPVAAKGKADPITAFRVLDLDLSGPMPQRRLDAPMVGRDRQRRVLAEAFDQAVDERVCHLFTILGAAGVGKSRLVAEFLASVRDEAQVLHGRCLSYGEGITYWPILDAIRQAAGLSEDDDDAAIRVKVAALIDDDRDRPVVVERVGQLLGRFGGNATREETFWAVRTLLESLARRRPVVLVLDDIHWAEPTLLDLIENLADWTHDAPLLLLAVARRELLEGRPEWGGGKSSATTISLEPLNDGESRELMVNLLGQVELSADLVGRIGTAAEGNPLFVEEMIAMLIERGYLERRGEEWVAVANITDVTVPPTISALLAARLDGLPSPERAVIERGAVEGQVFHGSAVTELAPADLRESVLDHLRALSRKELLRPDRSDFYGDEAFRFRHLLFRDAAYSAMPKEERADLHERFARWLERVRASHIVEFEEILAYHLQQAYRYRTELGPVDSVVQQLATDAGRHMTAAAQRAMHRGDIGAAMKLFESATELLPADDPARARVVADLGIAYSQGGDLVRSELVLRQALDEPQPASDPLARSRLEVVLLGTQSALSQISVEEVIKRSAELLALFEAANDEWGIERATFELGRHTFFAGHADEAEKLFSAYLARLPPSQLTMPLMFSFGIGAMFWGSTPVLEAIERVNAMDVGSSKALLSAQMRFLGGLHGLIGEFEVGRQWLLQMIELERELGRRMIFLTGHGHFLGPLEHLAGNLELAEEIMRTAYADLRGTGDLSFSATIAGNLAALYIDMRRLEDAEHYARIALDTSTVDDVSAQSSGRAVLAMVHAGRGEFEAAEREAREAISVSDPTDYLVLRGDASLALAEALRVAGRRDEAHEAAARALSEYDQKGATVYADRARARIAEIDTEPG